MADEKGPAPDGETGSKSFEMICGVLIAVFAAVLAVTDLGAGKPAA